MSVPKTLPAPRRNQTDAGGNGRFDELVAADFVLAAVGDYTGGAATNMFTLASHGLVDGDILYLVAQTAKGVLTGGVGTRVVVNELSSSTFACNNDAGTEITNTSDGTAFFLKGNGVPQRVADEICRRIYLATNDFTSGTVEDMVFTSGVDDLEDGDSIKLLYKSAAGAAAVAADASTFVKAPVNTLTSGTGQTGYFQTSATSGGAVADTTADGVLLWLKTS